MLCASSLSFALVAMHALWCMRSCTSQLESALMLFLTHRSNLHELVLSSCMQDLL
jgi:hypothetical protein